MFVAADYIGPSLPAFRKCTEGSVLVCTYTKRHRSLAVGRYDLRMVVAAMECTLTECPNAIHGRASVSTGDPSGSMSHPILLSGGAVHPRLLRGDAFSVITDKWFIRVGNFNDIKL